MAGRSSDTPTGEQLDAKLLPDPADHTTPHERDTMTTTTQTRPATPADWLVSGPADGPKYALRRVGGYLPYVVHAVEVIDGKWTYSSGQYCPTLSDGVCAYDARMAQ